MAVTASHLKSLIIKCRAAQIRVDDDRYMKKGEASNYVLPKADASTLGGVKVGSNITVSDGTISITKSNVTDALGYTPPEGVVLSTVPSSQEGGIWLSFS